MISHATRKPWAGLHLLLLSIVLGAFSACLETSVYQFPGSTDSQTMEDPEPSENPEESTVGIAFLSLNYESLEVMKENDSLSLKLAVELSNGETYNNISNFFDVPYDELDSQVRWYSNNANIVSVSDNGVLTANGVGATTVKATLLTASVSMDIIVEEEEVELTSLAFHQNSYTISDKTSKTLTLDADFSDSTRYRGILADSLKKYIDCDLNFSSSNTATAIILQTGLLTPVNSGTAVLKVQCGELEDSLTLTVSLDSSLQTGNESELDDADDEVLESVTITTDGTDWIIGGTKTLSVNLSFNTGNISGASSSFVTPEGEVGYLFWQSSDEEIVSISDGVASLFAYGNVVLTVSADEASDTLDVSVKMAVEEPDSSADYFLSSNDDMTITYGTNGGYGSHLFPAIVYGMPQTGGTHVVSFGGGGSLLLELNDYLVVDGVGVDLTIFENAIQSETYGNFAERALVSVSDDGIDYYSFDCDDNDVEEVYAGCAGVTPVNATENPLDPAVSGGDSFDLADVGLAQAKYILIEDLNTCTTTDPTYYAADGSILCATSGQQGFDLDAIAIVNGVNE